MTKPSRETCAHAWQPQEVAPIAAYLHAPPERFESARLCPKCGKLEIVALGTIEHVTTTVRVD
jgi:hypothetical protein